MKKTSEQISHNMRRVKCKGSKIESVLCSELWKRGMRYRRNVKAVFGKPDIAFVGKKVAIFCDSEFWHGYDWENKKHEIKSNREFWIAKIEETMRHDKEVTEALTEHGWRVLRFWGNDIKNNTANCADVIETVLGRK